MSENMNIDSLLDESIDSLEDLPEFLVYPNGAHKVTIEFTKKEINKKPAVEMKMVAVETVELSNPDEDTPLNAGDEASQVFFLDNEFGQGALKVLMKTLSAHLGTTTISETMAQAKGMEVTIINKKKPNKEKTAFYMGVSKIIID